MKDDKEIKAISVILGAIDGMEPDAVERVMRYVLERKAVSPHLLGKGGKSIALTPAVGGEGAQGPTEKMLTSYASLAEAFAAAGPPKSGTDKVLLVAALVQARQSPTGFLTRQVSAELKHLGHPVANITDTLNKLMGKRPQPITQLRKAGKSQQAQKTFKVTAEGIKAVGEMFSGERESD